ncbi:MAG: ATP-binding protein [Leptolyngbyaceae cyanobacterium bins.349]|nr:ATP-binding protein [Leptolyngbyaceae cyanobacterium bins.349]
MLQNPLQASTLVNLTNCDREPIHIPGSIQPHGILLVLSEPDFLIERISVNTEDLIGITATELLGQPLTTLLHASQIATLRQCLAGDFESINPLRLEVLGQMEPVPCDGIIHRSPQNKLILELEPISSEIAANFFNFFKLTQNILSRIHQSANLSQLCTLIVQEIRTLIGFDRVMVYQFDAQGAGRVIAEAKRDDLKPYLGLHYPDSDIPKQAKYLYTLNWLRLIPDVDYNSVPILSNSQSSADEPIDLSLSVLRSVSPIHIEYLKNMGVGASMSISLMQDHKLWGLIACHHDTPQFVPYEIRTVCEFLGQVMSLELATKEANENLEYKLKLKSIQTQFIDAVTQSDELMDGLVSDRASLLDAVGAEGAAVCLNGNVILVGKTPTESEVYELLSWLPDQFHNHVFVTDALPSLYPPARAFKDVASGLLALSITKIQPNYVLWFRPEIVQQVHWAGDPEKPKRVETDGSLTIFPRQSFERWQETVRLKSRAWEAYEVAGAVELRSAIVGIVLRKADELATINLELERSNNELDAFAYIASHDLKEPLRGIHNYSTFLLEDYSSVLAEDGVAKLQTLIRLTKRMEDLINSLLHFSRLGRQELDVRSLNLNELVQTVVEMLGMSQANEAMEIRIPCPLPTIEGDRILMEEVFTNLISNALKYNDKATRWVEIGYLEPHESHQEWRSRPQAMASPHIGTFYVRDNGIGIQTKHLDTIFRIFKRLHAPGKYGDGTGAGLTIVKKIVERHGGTVWVESVYGEGSTFYFTLPLPPQKT